MKIYVKYRFLLNFNNLNNSNGVIRVLAYFQLIIPSHNKVVEGI